MASSAELRASELITVASMPIWSPFTRSKPCDAPLSPRKMFAAANHYCHLNAALHGLLDLLSIFAEAHGVDAVTLGSGKRFAA